MHRVDKSLSKREGPVPVGSERGQSCIPNGSYLSSAGRHCGREQRVKMRRLPAICRPCVRPDPPAPISRWCDPDRESRIMPAPNLPTSISWRGTWAAWHAAMPLFVLRRRWGDAALIPGRWCKGCNPLHFRGVAIKPLLCDPYAFWPEDTQHEPPPFF